MSTGNAPQSFNGPQFVLASRTTAQVASVSANDPIVYETNTTAGSAVSVVNATGVFTLAAGRTYLLEGDIGFATGSGPTAALQVRWFNITGAAFIGVAASLGADTGTADDGLGGTARAVITPAVATTVELRIVSNTAVTGIGTTTASPSGFVRAIS
jgi:hypothetical protein